MEQGHILSAGPSRRDLTAEEIRARLRDRAAGTRISEGARGDHTLSGGTPPTRLTPAAVLVGITQHPQGLSVLLTQRTAHLTDHAGQISLPGGRIERSDPDPVFAALR